MHGHSNFYIVSAGNWLIEVEKLRYVMILLWERQGYEKERSCFHTKLLLSIEFDTTCEPGATFSQRWHQSFNQRIFDRLLQVAVEVCMWLLPPQHSKSLTFRNKKQKGKKHYLAYGILLFVSLTYFSLFPHSHHCIWTIYWQKIQGACSLWTLAFECSFHLVLVQAFHWDSA